MKCVRILCPHHHRHMNWDRAPRAVTPALAGAPCCLPQPGRSGRPAGMSHLAGVGHAASLCGVLLHLAQPSQGSSLLSVSEWAPFQNRSLSKKVSSKNFYYQTVHLKMVEVVRFMFYGSLPPSKTIILRFVLIRGHTVGFNFSKRLYGTYKQL